MAAYKTPEEILEADLVFHEQADGRLVAKIAGGKAVLLDREDIGRVKDGERWTVRLSHRETFAIATLVKPSAENPLIPSRLGEAFKSTIPKKSGPAAGSPAGSEFRPSPENAAGQPEFKPVLLPSGSLPPIPDVFDAAGAGSGRTQDPARIIRPTDRIALFVDGANMDWACRRAGYFVDYGKAREFFTAGGLFYAAYYYVADFTDRDPLQIRFLDFLARAGYIVRRRSVKILYDEDTGERILKGNLDTEIVLDMLNTVDNYDVAFLFSGDSDFDRAVDLMRSRGKRVYVVTAARQLSRELMYAADKPIFFLESCRAALNRAAREEAAGEGKPPAK